jgi:hypothetical protein
LDTQLVFEGADELFGTTKGTRDVVTHLQDHFADFVIVEQGIESDHFEDIGRRHIDDGGDFTDGFIGEAAIGILGDVKESENRALFLGVAGQDCINLGTVLLTK